jgi:hypothetical protein
MRIQIASDLHLEERPKMVFQELLTTGLAPLLALLGDIAPLDHENLRPFLEWCSEHWETVVWIPGCLELLGSGDPIRKASDLEKPVQNMRDICASYKNIQVLYRETMISSDGLYIIGLPFWKYPRDTTALWNPQFGRYVQAEPSPFSPGLLRQLHLSDLSWLRTMVKSQMDPVMILSHTGPVTWLQEESFVGDPGSSHIFYDVEELLRPPIVAWACGHVHASVEYQKEWNAAGGKKETVLLVTNAKGRSFENLYYRTDAILRIDPSLARQNS